MKYILPLLLIVFIFQQSLAQDYVPGLIVVKLKKEDSSARKNTANELSLDRLRQDGNIKNIQSLKSRTSNNQRTAGDSRLDNIYKLEISEDIKEAEYIDFLN